MVELATAKLAAKQRDVLVGEKVFFVLASVTKVECVKTVHRMNMYRVSILISKSYKF